MKKIAGLIVLVLMLTAGMAVADTIILPADTTTIETEAFYGTDAVTIVLPEGVTTIGDRAFGGSESLLAVYVPAGLMDRETDALTDSENAHFYPLTDASLFEYAGENSLTITKYKGTQNTVVIPSEIQGKPVTAIGSNAFNNSNGHNITRVVIPEGVTEIGGGAFADCQYLEYVSFPSTLTTLGGGAFSFCGYKITDHDFSYHLPDRITSIVQDGSNSSTFYNCKAVKVVKPESMTAYKMSDLSGYSNVNAQAYKNQWFAFEGCEDYRYLYFTENDEQVLYLMKYEGSGEAISIPHDDKTTPAVIADGAFQGKTSLTRVEIPEGVETINRFAFQGCVNLTDVLFPSSLQTLGENAFTGCGQNAAAPFSFRLPDHISSIAMTHSTTDTFASCSAVRIVSPGSETAYLFSEQIVGAQDPAAAYPYHYFTFPGSEHADFRYLYYRETVEDEEEWVLHLIKYLGNDAEVTIPAQAGDKPALGVIQASAFENNFTIQKITIPDSVRRFGRAAFAGCKYLVDVTFPESLEYMESNVFSGCGKQYVQDKNNANEDPTFWYDLPDNIKDLVYDNSTLATFYDCPAKLRCKNGTTTWITLTEKGYVPPWEDE